MFFFLAAGLLVAAPWYFDARGGVRTAWFVGAFVLGLIGFLGALVELSEMSGGSGSLKEFGAVIFLGVATMAAGVPPIIWALRSPWEGLLKAIALVLALATVLGLSMETGKWYRAEARNARKERVKPERSLADTVVTVGLAVLSFATSVVGLWAAFASRK